MFDIVIPVYNEGQNILRVLESLERKVHTPSRIFLCYDFETDDTLQVIRSSWHGSLELYFVKNRGTGPHAAVLSGFDAGKNPHVVVYPADDDYNANILDSMVSLAQGGYDIVCASRFMAGGTMVNCPLLKSILVRVSAFVLYYFAGLPTHDASNGFRLFSRKLLNRVSIESTEGFTYSLELLAKCHRLRWPIAEVPAQWMERKEGQSRFKVLHWLPAYLRWFNYIFATTYLQVPSSTVMERTSPNISPVYNHV